MRAKGQDFIVYLRRAGGMTTVKAKDGLTLGHDYACDITVDDDRLPKSYKLLSRRGNSYLLRLPDTTVGTIAKDGDQVSIASLIKLGLLKEESKGYYVFDMRSEADVEIRLGKDDSQVTLSFGYKERPKRIPIRVAIPFITSREYLFLTVFVISIVSHVLLAFYLDTVEIKKTSSIEALKKLPPRFARLILTPQKKAEIKKRTLDLKKEEEIEKKKEEPKKPNKKDKAKKKKKTDKASVPKGVKGKGVLGVIAAKGGILSSATAGELWRDVDTLVATSGAETTTGADNLRGLDTGGDELSEEDITADWTQDSRSKEDILKERKKRTALKVAKKKPVVATTDNLRHEAEVYRIVRSYSGGLKYLYNNELRRDPSLKGTITITITITAEGKVKDALVKDSTLKSPSLEAAMVKRIYMWRFREVEEAPDFTINYTFDFSPVG